MEFKKVAKRAVEIGEMYEKLEEKKYGRKWGASELLQGFMGDSMHGLLLLDDLADGYHPNSQGH